MKWLHTFLSIGALVVTAISPVLSNAVAGHPTIALTLGALYAILGHLLPSPVGSTGTAQGNAQ